MEVGDIINLAVGLGVGGILTKLVDRLLDRRQGRISEQQSAWEQRDREATRRRKLEEALHETRRCLHEHGVPYRQMPPWPGRTRPDDQ